MSFCLSCFLWVVLFLYQPHHVLLYYILNQMMENAFAKTLMDG